MPNRIVRGEVLRSERYHDVSETARLFFLELLLIADDYGLCHLAPVALRMSCPAAMGRSTEQLAKLLSELHDVDLVRVYEVRGARYGFIPRFGNWPKAQKPKYPLPPDEMSSKEINDLVSKRQSRRYPDAVHRVRNGSAEGLPPDPQSGTETETETETENLRARARVRKRLASRQASVDLAVRPSDVPANVWSDYLTLRAAKNLPLTDTALAEIQAEAAKAKLSLADALRTCCNRGWGGFEARWLESPPGKQQARTTRGGFVA